MLKVQSLTLVLAFGLGLAGCSHSASQIAVSGNARIAADVSPGVSGEANTIRLRSTDGTPSSLTIDMPDMAMRPEPYRLQKDGEGFTAPDVRFSMAGTWRIKIYDSAHAALGTFMVRIK